MLDESLPFSNKMRCLDLGNVPYSCYTLETLFLRNHFTILSDT